MVAHRVSVSEPVHTKLSVSGSVPESDLIVIAKTPVAGTQGSGTGDGVGDDRSAERIARPTEVTGDLGTAQPSRFLHLQIEVALQRTQERICRKPQTTT